MRGFHAISPRPALVGQGGRTQSHPVALSQTSQTSQKVSSRFNPPSLKLRRTRVQSSKSRKPATLSPTQSSQSHLIAVYFFRQAARKGRRAAVNLSRNN